MQIFREPSPFLPQEAIAFFIPQKLCLLGSVSLHPTYVLIFFLGGDFYSRLGYNSDRSLASTKKIQLTPSPEPDHESQKASLIAELQEAGIKHTPEKILRIAKTVDGKIVFLEEGNARSGLQHIVENHISQFADLGISPNQIPDAIITAVTKGQIVGTQGKRRSNPRIIYQFTFNGETKYLAVQGIHRQC